MKVTQNGVMWNGFRYGSREPALKRLLGQKVTLRADPADVTRLTAWTLDGKFICVAPSDKRLPKNATKEAVEEAMREKNHDLEAQLTYKKARVRMQENLTDKVHARWLRRPRSRPARPGRFAAHHDEKRDPLAAGGRAAADGAGSGVAGPAPQRGARGWTCWRWRMILNCRRGGGTKGRPCWRPSWRMMTAMVKRGGAV